MMIEKRYIKSSFNYQRYGLILKVNENIMDAAQVLKPIEHSFLKQLKKHFRNIMSILSSQFTHFPCVISKFLVRERLDYTPIIKSRYCDLSYLYIIP